MHASSLNTTGPESFLYFPVIYVSCSNRYPGGVVSGRRSAPHSGLNAYQHSIGGDGSLPDREQGSLDHVPLFAKYFPMRQQAVVTIVRVVVLWMIRFVLPLYYCICTEFFFVVNDVFFFHSLMVS